MTMFYLVAVYHVCRSNQTWICSGDDEPICKTLETLFNCKQKNRNQCS